MKNFMKLYKVIILGSGGLQIGQAGEFDYSGSQAIKALKEEGIKTVLVNPNIATVQTDPNMADALYLQPLNFQTLKKIIAKEKPDGILLGFGGQTALNLGLELDEKAVLQKYGMAVLGSDTQTIRTAEDRNLFKIALAKIGVKTPKSFTARDVNEALAAGKQISYPLMIRSGFSLGGLGSGKIADARELKQRAGEALSGAPQILVEEYLGGWKEVEYEVVRDRKDNTIIVCNMENMDPMGIHTGESIVVAPSQTLNNEQYHRLRELSIKIARHLKIIGECNVQFALHPKTGDYRVIELNPRLSRSSALASKATGYPLAYIAAKLAIGKLLPELKNSVTKKTSAFFEPALDYLTIKIPRWDTNKLRSAERSIGSEMKSVGEVMAIGRSFPEALQKAVRMLNIGADGLSDYPFPIAEPKKEMENATDRRLFALYQFFKKGGGVKEAGQLTSINEWFLAHIKNIAALEKTIKNKRLTPALLLQAKQFGFSDVGLAKLKNTDEKKIRRLRKKNKILPCFKQIDTLAGEYPAETNYLYATYHGAGHDIAALDKKPIIVLGSGPYAIGSSVEFDWCAVNTARALRALDKKTIMLNSNPETVSTDYDESDRLYFEELTLERVADIADFEGGAKASFESTPGIVVSVGGQIANKIALPLFEMGYKILGTPPVAIDQAEDRQKFSSLLNKLKIDQPEWIESGNLSKAKAFAKNFGYPVLVRPSYVLSGAAMNVCPNEDELTNYLRSASAVSPDHPVVISKFITNAKELDIDGVADKGKIIIEAICEHVENAGVHSGDATLVLPPQKLYLETIRRAKNIARAIAKSLKITGPFNIQFIAKDNALKVIECNLRASRSFPFVSKVTGHNFIELATKAMLGGVGVPPPLRGRIKEGVFETLELNHVGVKSPQFSYHRLKGADPVAQVEMASTGEVACIGGDYLRAFYSSWLATGKNISRRRALVTIADECKQKFLPLVKKMDKQGWEIYTTAGTHDFLSRHGVASNFVYKISEQNKPNVEATISEKQVDVIIVIPSEARNLCLSNDSDGYKIRRLATDRHIPLITNSQTAILLLRCLTELDANKMPIKSWQEYF
ncbi:carbamoyl-phosphate synthase (glutamine-hydrolyzing) large subunit [Patescibacteria group bacterium]|nr:MAG: carbamoyl-phosphate synthase (glutamine-hydrolyzing) large subunit [Patescibacteria group bacterium]